MCLEVGRLVPKTPSRSFVIRARWGQRAPPRQGLISHRLRIYHSVLSASTGFTRVAFLAGSQHAIAAAAARISAVAASTSGS
jgi:hypothetical protein